MKKLLLTACALILGLGGVNAETVKKYRLGSELTLNEIKSGETSFAIVRSSDQQLLVYGTGGNVAAMKSADDVSLKDRAPFFKCVAIASNNEYSEKLNNARIAAENAFNGDESNESLFMFRVYKADGTPFSLWGSNQYYVSHCGWTANSNTLNLADNKFGGDTYYGAIWKVVSTDGGYTIQSQSIDNKNYLIGNGGPQVNPVAWKFYQLEAYEETNPIDPGTYDATDAMVLLNAGEHTSKIELTWDEGLDLSAYRYLVITLGQSSNESGNAGEVALISKNQDGEVTVKGDSYGVNNANMWFGTYNHHYTCPIDLEKLRTEKMFDIHNVYKLSIGISGSVIVNNIYATNAETKTIGPWGNPDDEGTYRNVKKELAAGTFGTVCLPYQASYAGVTVYEIEGKTTGTLELTPIYGLMEAGKAYFYQVNTPLNPDPAKKVVPRAYFYKANTTADVATPVASNGLVGTFTNTAAPQGYYVLSSNKLYKVNSEVSVGANHACINLDEVPAVASEVKAVKLAFDDEVATSISGTDEQVQVKAIYSVNGTVQRGMKKGVNIVKMSDGSVKKVLVK